MDDEELYDPEEDLHALRYEDWYSPNNEFVDAAHDGTEEEQRHKAVDRLSAELDRLRRLVRALEDESGPLFCDDVFESEVCDFCFYYDYNGRKGVYTGHGVCWHPEHPKQCDPDGGCCDFRCGLRKPSGKTAWARVEERITGQDG